MAITENQVWRMPFTREQIQAAQENVVPRVGVNGHWWRWNINTMQYEDAGATSGTEELVAWFNQSIQQAETYRDQAQTYSGYVVQYAQSASGSATQAKNAASASQASAETAASAAAKAQAEADRATVPALKGVYNLILPDRVTGEKYALIVENGAIQLLGVSDKLDATEDFSFVDRVTGVSFAVCIESGKLKLEEV